MKVLVYGPYPPSLLPGVRDTLASVREQLATGAEVTVVSPVRSAAHRRARLDGQGRLLLAKWIAGSDGVVLHFPAVGLGNRVGQAAWSTVGLALRRCQWSRVHVAPFEGAADAGWARLVLRQADKVVAASDGNRAALVSAGLPADMVEVAERATSDAEPAPAGTDGGGAPTGAASGAVHGAPAFAWAGLAADAPAADIQAEVAAQAAGLRQSASSRSAEADPRAVGAARVLLTLPPLIPAPPSSARRGAGLVKGIVQRLTLWQVEPMVSRINELQQATVLAFEEYSRSAPPSSD